MAALGAIMRSGEYVPNLFSVAMLAQKHSAVTVALPLVSSPRIVAGHATNDAVHWRDSRGRP